MVSAFYLRSFLELFDSALNYPRSRDFTETPETTIHFWKRPKRNPSLFRPWRATAKRQTPTHAPLLLLLFLLSLFLYALRRSTLSASVEQEHRTESQLCAYTHARTASCGIPHGASGFPSAYQVRLLPGDGRCSSRVSASSERRRRVLLIGDAAGSPPLFLFLAQEPSYIDASSRDLKTFGQDITCTAFVIFGGLRGVEDFSGRALLSAVSMRLWSEYLQKLQVSSEALRRLTSNIQESEGASVPFQPGSGRELVIALARWRKVCCTCSRCAKPGLRARTEPGRLDHTCRWSANRRPAAIRLNLEPRGDRISNVLPFHVTHALHPLWAPVVRMPGACSLPSQPSSLKVTNRKIWRGSRAWFTQHRGQTHCVGPALGGV